uniref:Large ribosomal subunit protein uL18 n=1 Tax=uncultured Microgenomates bacterium Rifle_16ft_4_minimus_5036 TaxID=1665119 RepID=A0A0H4T916_9BACT|nr:50S ribosomal protein L18 [uncultured Microgenomates bacterium Rifle_16ft_4_minimus_5036]
MKDKRELRLKRRKRIRGSVEGTSERPRLSVFRSNTHIYAQIIDDSKGVTIVSANDLELVKPETKKKSKTESSVEKSNKTKIDKATLVGEEIATKAKDKKIKRVVFDRGGYKFHGIVKALAEGARKGGLEF